MVYYYLYLIKFEDGRFYIGSRKSRVPAVDDINYWGSPGKTNKHLWDMKKEKFILFESSDISYKDLTNKEKVFIKEGWKKFGKHKCVNKSIGGNIDPDFISKSIKKRYADDPQLYEVAKENGKNSKELGLGFHAESFKPRRKKISTQLGLKLHKDKKGIFDPKYKKEKIKWGKIRGPQLAKEIMESKKGIFDPHLQKHRSEWASIGGYASMKSPFSSVKPKKYKFISPEGKVYEGENISQFCRENDLLAWEFRNLALGKPSKKLILLGWRLG
tara:strand:- start:39 stop:854 length:816 start_codon:yes stop_codon:yes gene_type:complete